MSRTKHYSLDDAEVLETKVDQLEKRLENIERFVFSQPKQDTSSAQLVQVIAALIEKQNNNKVDIVDDKNENRDKEKEKEKDIGEENNNSKKNSSNKDSHSHLNIDRLRTVI